jgi:hypothetical protein
MRPGRIVAIIIGSLFALISIGVLVGGGALLWAHTTQRDADGFLVGPRYGLVTDTNALISGNVDLGARPGDWFPSGLADVRLVVTPGVGEEIFVGIGPSDDVDGYLAGVALDEVTELGLRANDVDYESRGGDVSPMPPGAEAFWVASAEGPDTQSVEWEVDAGEWTVVVMNADGSAGIDVALRAGVRTDFLLAVTIGLLIFGVFLAAGAAALIIWGTRRPRDEEAAEAAAPAAIGVASDAYPVIVEGEIDPDLSRGMWLIKWFLALPHYIVLAFLAIAFMLLSIVAFFAILFTGRYPRGIFDFNVGVIRWGWRVQFYAFGAAATDEYPPFTLADVDYPARFTVEYPETLSRGLVLVKWWLLAIPHLIIVGLFTNGLVWWVTDVDGDWVLQTGGGLIGILTFIALVILLFTGRYPQGMFDLVMGLNRWVYRVWTYVGLMRDEYPPFRLDMGGPDPGRVAEPASPEPSPSDVTV